MWSSGNWSLQQAAYANIPANEGLRCEDFVDFIYFTSLYFFIAVFRTL